jgi:methionyl-tRNA formyltransferase
LLPRWRGASPIQSAILAGDKKTGVTIMKMDAGIDTGDIISMEKVEITDSMNSEQLSEQLSSLGAKMIVETLNDVPTALQSAFKQPEEGAIYAEKITKDFCQLNWNDTAENIQHKIMALSPAPAAWFEIDGSRVKVTDAQVSDSADYPSGTIFANANGEMCVSCKDGAVLIKTLQPAGKKPMRSSDFLRGHQSLVGKGIQLV